MWKGVADRKKVKRLSKEEIRKQLLESMIINEVVSQTKTQNELKVIQDPEKAAEIIRQYEDIIKTNKKGTLNVAFHQGQIFKRFKEKEKFAKLISESGIHKVTLIFKINAFKQCKIYRKLLKSSIGLRFFKSYHKDIKAICKKNEEDFQ